MKVDNTQGILFIAEYNNLREETKAQYKYFLGIVCSTSVVDGKKLGSYKLSNLTTKLAKLS